MSLHKLKLRFQIIYLINSLGQLLINTQWTLLLLLIFCIQFLIISHQYLLTLIVTMWLLLLLLISLLRRWSVSRFCVDCSCIYGDFVYYMVWDECLFNILCGNYCWDGDWLDHSFVQWPVLYDFCCRVRDQKRFWWWWDISWCITIRNSTLIMCRWLYKLCPTQILPTSNHRRHSHVILTKNLLRSHRSRLSHQIILPFIHYHILRLRLSIK